MHLPAHLLRLACRRVVLRVRVLLARRQFRLQEGPLPQLHARDGQQQRLRHGYALAKWASPTLVQCRLQELLADYEDYFRVRDLQQWGPGDARLSQAQRACSQHNDSAFYRNAMPSRSPETIANIAITLIHQTDWLLSRLIEKLEKKFVESGGMRELMTKARKEYRGY